MKLKNREVERMCEKRYIDVYNKIINDNFDNSNNYDVIATKGREPVSHL